MGKRVVLNFALVLSILAVLVLIYHCKNPKLESEYYNPIPLATHYNGEHFVGSETCMECHSHIYADHQQTAHFKTSAKANYQNVLGSFEPGSNILDLEYARFSMVQKGDSLYQQIKFKNRTTKKPPSTFDMVIGSGTRGQSYATWKGDELFQLQTSYHTATDSWVNSPGFPNYGDNDRPVRAACLKCHITFAETTASPSDNRYDKSKMVYGIDCERCHRPSQKHVSYHRKNPEVKTARFMLPLDSLPQQQRLDICAQCHSGARDRILKGNPFSFLSGEILDEYMQNSRDTLTDKRPDVHGNQYGLLIQSECFKQTERMDCTTCHNPHKNQRGNSAYFNQKCAECHTSEAVICAAEDATMKTMSNNCIACHMPVTPSEIMKVRLNRTDSLETSFYIRSHLIGVYNEVQPQKP